MSNSAASFGRMLREQRRSVGLTQAELADKIGVSNTYISALESGRKQAPPRALVEALAVCLQVPAETLWETARAEREARLRARINGVPTSLRVPRSAVLERPAGEADEMHLDRILEPLKESLRNAEDPKRIVHALKELADLLGGGSK